MCALAADKSSLEQPDPIPYKERQNIRRVQRMITKTASGPGELASFNHVGQYTDNLKNQIRVGFQDTRMNRFSRERLVSARPILVEAQAVLAILRPLVFGFKIAQAPAHIASSVLELSQRVKALDELVEEKEKIAANFDKE